MAELLVADPAADRDEWLALRRQGVTATDIGTILGLTSWDSPWALYHRKKGLLPEVEQTDRMRLGSWLEDAVVNHWGTVTRFSGNLYGGLWRSSERPWQLATPDATVSAYDDSKRVVAVLECKTSATRDGWGHERCTEDGCSYCNKIPAHIRAQVLWQMDVLGVPAGHVAVVFLPSGEFRSYTIEHGAHPCRWPDNDCGVCGDLEVMRDAGLEFYQRLRGELPPPPLDGSQATLDGLRHLYSGRVDGKEVEVPPSLAVEWLNACDDYEISRQRKAEAAAKVRDAMGEGHYGLWRGVRFARRDVFTKAEYRVPEHEEDRLMRVKMEGISGDDD